MINDVKDINTDTEDGRLAFAFLARLTATIDGEKTPEEVIAAANRVALEIFEGSTLAKDSKTTNELIELLTHKEGVNMITVPPKKDCRLATIDGPAIILVVKG